MWTGYMDFGTGLLVGWCVQGNEHTNSKHCGELLDQLGNYKLLQ